MRMRVAGTRSSVWLIELAGFISMAPPGIQVGSARFPGVADALLNAANQLVLLAFDEFQIVMHQLREFLFQPAFGDFPVAFDKQSAHAIPWDLISRGHRPLKSPCKRRAAGWGKMILVGDSWN
jgi:hypothetical protein